MNNEMKFPHSQTSSPDLTVVHNKEEEMFSLSLPGHEVAFLKYRFLDRQQTTVEMFTTVVPPSLGGRGVAKILADEAFDWAVENDLKMKLTCWYLSGYLQRHPRDSVSKLTVS